MRPSQVRDIAETDRFKSISFGKLNGCFNDSTRPIFHSFLLVFFGLWEILYDVGIQMTSDDTLHRMNSPRLTLARFLSRLLDRISFAL